MSDTWIDRNEFPFKARFFNVPAERLHYIDEGAGNHALVMVHGNPTWSFSYRHLIRVSQRNTAVSLWITSVLDFPTNPENGIICRKAMPTT